MCSCSVISDPLSIGEYHTDTDENPLPPEANPRDLWRCVMLSMSTRRHMPTTPTLTLRLARSCHTTHIPRLAFFIYIHEVHSTGSCVLHSAFISRSLNMAKKSWKVAEVNVRKLSDFGQSRARFVQSSSTVLLQARTSPVYPTTGREVQIHPSESRHARARSFA